MKRGQEVWWVCTERLMSPDRAKEMGRLGCIACFIWIGDDINVVRDMNLVMLVTNLA